MPCGLVWFPYSTFKPLPPPPQSSRICVTQRKKPVAFPCTDTRAEVPAIVEMVESPLAWMHKSSQQNNLNLEVNLLKGL